MLLRWALFSIVVSLATATAKEDESCIARNLLSQSDDSHLPPFVTPRLLWNGKVISYSRDGQKETNVDDDSIVPPTNVVLSNVTGCCRINNDDDIQLEPHVLGQMPQLTQDDSLRVLQIAKKAWNKGRGIWPQMSLKRRIRAIEAFLEELKSNQRNRMIQVLMWEIGKNYNDASAEFDRTMAFCEKAIAEIKTNGSWHSSGSTRAWIRRAAIGIVLCLGPYNYPLNETYATLIPALLMGNVAIMKIPTVGGLVHLLTIQAFSKTLPPGAMNFISGSGRTTMPPLMATGDVDVLAFVGGSDAADDLIKQHPHPHRLKLFLQLEAKNMGVFLPDLWEANNESSLQSALDQAVLGGTSYNGQRCTALKLFFVPRKHAEAFLEEFVKRVEQLTVGLPWNKDENSVFSQITPLPNQKRVEYMKALLDDASNKGAKIIYGGTIVGGLRSTLMIPAVVYPVASDMDLYHREQFGPILPIVPYDEYSEILEYASDSPYAQQISLFTANDVSTLSHVLDQVSNIFGKININTQCGRSPDHFPFTGRKSSAMGVMSVSDALKEFSIPTVVSYKEQDSLNNFVSDLQAASTFMEPVD